MTLFDTPPLNALIGFYILYGIQKLLLPSVPASFLSVTSKGTNTAIPDNPHTSYTWMPRAHPPTLVFTTYTPKTLAEHNGLEGRNILLAIKGAVFDVTNGGSFYGPG